MQQLQITGFDKWGEGRYQTMHQSIAFDPTTKGQFQTPPFAVKYMVSLLPSKKMKVLEPTPGHGNIQMELQKKGHIVTAPKDYFLLSKRRKFDAVVMNPPYSTRFVDRTNAPASMPEGLKAGYWFLTDCMRRAPVVIALMPWFTISDSDVRLRYLFEWGLRAVIPMPRKTFAYARIQTVILHLEHGYNGRVDFTPFEFVRKKRGKPMF